MKSDQAGIKGLIIATAIITAWLCNLLTLLSVKISVLPLPLILSGILLQMFLNTGLFITAHDAIHGLVYPTSRSINHLVGTFCVSAYALLSYRELFKKHWLHHSHPASDADPDFCDQENVNFLSWYIHFMQQYWSWQKFVQFISVVGAVGLIVKFSLVNLVVFWGVPLILSSLQLFYFGTYLPHQEPEEGYHLPHCAKSYPLPWLLSFLACYHFSYHQEHHEYPNVPWWQLPNLYSDNRCSRLLRNF